MNREEIDRKVRQLVGKDAADQVLRLLHGSTGPKHFLELVNSWLQVETNLPPNVKMLIKKSVEAFVEDILAETSIRVYVVELEDPIDALFRKLGPEKTRELKNIADKTPDLAEFLDAVEMYARTQSTEICALLMAELALMRNDEHRHDG